MLAGAFVVAVAIIPLFIPHRGGDGELPLAQQPPAPQPAKPSPPNAFVPSGRNRLAPISGIPSFEIPSLPQLAIPMPSSPSLTSTPQESVATLKKVKKSALPAESPLPLPPVRDSELSVALGGVQSFDEFAGIIVDSGAKLQFERARFVSILRESDGVPYAVADLMDMALLPGGWAAAKPSLLTVRDFVAARIAYVKTVKVSGGAVELARAMVAFDMLTEGLLNELLASDGNPSVQLRQKISAYDAAGTYYNNEFGKRAWQTSFHAPDIFNVLTQLSSFFVRRAHAQVGGKPPFGGKISFRMDCSVCNTGFVIHLNNAVNDSSLALFVSWSTFASPLFYINKNPNAGQNIVGLYNRESGQCEQPVCEGECCAVDNYDGKLYMAGTS